MSHAVNEGLVAYVRLSEGGVVQLNAGDTVPDEADLNHVAQLVEQGVLTGDDSKPNGVEAILAAVGDDVEMAQAYLDEENATASPRKTLVAALAKVIAGSSDQS